MTRRVRKLFSLVLCLLFGLSLVIALQPQVHATTVIDTELPKYNVAWTSPSTDIKGSMPIGNGLVGAMVWATSGGDLMLQVATTDSWDENLRSIKLGNVRFSCNPNPFASGKPFNQTLSYKEGKIVIVAGNSPAITFTIWADANNPTLHVESTASSGFTLTVKEESWRTSLKHLTTLDNGDYYHVASAPKSTTSTLNVYETPDIIMSGQTNKVVWYHRNDTYSHWAETLINQATPSTGIADPIRYRTSGAIIQGTNLANSNNNTLTTSSSNNSYRVDITCNTKICSNVQDWVNETTTKSNSVWSANIDTLRSNHENWWNNYWNRGYMFVTGDSDATKVTKGFINARYVFACAGRGENPIEMNGSIFGFTNDAKPWHDYTGFNQRFAFWSMLPSGDFDQMQPYFKMMVNSIPLSKARTKSWWGHDGLILPEHMMMYGPWTGCQYGWDRTGKAKTDIASDYVRYLYTNTPEIGAMMLDYYEYTQDDSFVTNELLPYAKEVVIWYDQHWGRNSSGKIDMYPIYSGETDRTCRNCMADVASLTKVVNGLLALPTNLTTQADRDYWNSIKNQLPAFPISGGRLNTAENLVQGNDSNNQNLYPIFPLRFYGYGLPNLQLAVDSYNNRTGKYPGSGTQAWRHDACHAAYLGLTDEAKYQVSNAFQPAQRFEGYMAGSPDGDPGMERLAIGKIGLQAMLIHPAGTKINFLNAWPDTWSVKFKLNAPMNTVIEGEYNAGTITSFNVTPSARLADIVVRGNKPLPPPIVTVTPTPTVNPTSSPTPSPSPSPTATPILTPTPVPSGTNLALNQPVTCSSEQTGNEASHMVDGDAINTRWSTSPYPQWAQVDLGGINNISRTELAPYSNRAYQYKIEVSTNGTNYSLVVDKTSNTVSAALLTDNFATVNARYVKLTVTGCYNYTGTWISINEFRVYGDSGTIPTSTPTPTSTIAPTSTPTPTPTIAPTSTPTPTPTITPTATPTSNPGTPIKFECENLTTSTSGPTEQTQSDTNASGGANSKFLSTAVGDWVQYTVNVAAAGTYDIKVCVRKNTDKGICQTYIDGVSQGGTIDEYASASAYVIVDIGNKTFTTTGDKIFRFQVTGKNGSSSGYGLSFDYITLTPQ